MMKFFLKKLSDYRLITEYQIWWTDLRLHADVIEQNYRLIPINIVHLFVGGRCKCSVWHDSYFIGCNCRWKIRKRDHIGTKRVCYQNWNLWARSCSTGKLTYANYCLRPQFDLEYTQRFLHYLKLMNKIFFRYGSALWTPKNGTRKRTCCKIRVRYIEFSLKVK